MVRAELKRIYTLRVQRNEKIRKSLPQAMPAESLTMHKALSSVSTSPEIVAAMYRVRRHVPSFAFPLKIAGSSMLCWITLNDPGEQEYLTYTNE